MTVEISDYDMRVVPIVAMVVIRTVCLVACKQTGIIALHSSIVISSTSSSSHIEISSPLDPLL